MGLKENLDFAQHAVNYVRTFRTKDNPLVGMRAGNEERKTPMSDEERVELERCIGLGPHENRRDSVRMKMAFLCRNTGDGKSIEACLQQMPEAMGKMAEYAMDQHCGNCQEQDAVAINFLVGKGARPLDFMHLHPKVDHSFVVIGRAKLQWVWNNPTAPQSHQPPPSPPYSQPSTLEQPPNFSRQIPSLDDDPTTWGPDAVICDPWHNNGKVYPAKDFQDQMYRGRTPVKGLLQPASVWRIE
jgi:hypothetical protein